MILIDLSQIMVASTMMSMGKEESEVDIDMVRHMILNSLRMYRSKYHDEYGELVYVVMVDILGEGNTFLNIRQLERLIVMQIIEIGHKYLVVLIPSNQNLKNSFHTNILRLMRQKQMIL